jgi:hypothetical protein
MHRRQPIKLVDHEHIARFEAFSGNGRMPKILWQMKMFISSYGGELFVLAGLYSFPLRNAGKYFVNDALI